MYIALLLPSVSLAVLVEIFVWRLVFFERFCLHRSSRRRTVCCVVRCVRWRAEELRLNLTKSDAFRFTALQVSATGAVSLRCLRTGILCLRFFVLEGSFNIVSLKGFHLLGIKDACPFLVTKHMLWAPPPLPRHQPTWQCVSTS